MLFEVDDFIFLKVVFLLDDAEDLEEVFNLCVSFLEFWYRFSGDRLDEGVKIFVVVFFKPLLELTLKTLEHINRLISVLDFFSDCINSLEKNDHIFPLFVLAENARVNI